MFTTLATDLLTYSEGDLFLIFEKEKDGSVTVHDETYRTGGGVTYDPYMGAGDDNLTSICNTAYNFLKG